MIDTTIRAGRVVVGLVAVAGGAAMLVLPGPGLLVLVGGLALLGREFDWARRANGWLRRQAGRVVGRGNG